MHRMFHGTQSNVRLSEPFISPEDFSRAFQNCTYWNNGYAPGEYWSLKNSKWSFAMSRDLFRAFQNTAFAGIRTPPLLYGGELFQNCQYFDSDLTDFVLSWQYTDIKVRDIITGSGLSVENYSKFLIAIKQSYDNNNSRFNFNDFKWNINQYYNSSALSARNALEGTFPNKIIDLGLE